MKLADLRAPTIAVALFAAFTLLYCWARPVYEFALTWWGIKPLQSPFLDTGAVIAAIECYRQGIDVYVTNPCDVFGRPHVYSPLWLAASVLPVTSAWTTPAGLALSVLFLFSLAAIPTPAEKRDQWLLVACVVSTMSVYAVERANNDLVIFLLVLAAGRLVACSRPRWRRCAYPLVILAALLKFYPIAGLFVSLHERRRIFLVVNGLALLTTFIFIVAAGPDLARVMAVIPTGSYYTDWFGARNLPLGIAALLSKPSSSSVINLLAPTLVLILGSRALWIATALARRAALRDALCELPETEKLLLIIGAALITGCFFAGHNIGYRGIFLILVLPGICAVGHKAGKDESGKLCSSTAKLIMFVMWSEALRHAIFAARPLDLPAWHLFEAAFWIARELVWWRIIAVLIGILFSFLRSHSFLWRVASDALTQDRTVKVPT